MKSTFQINHSGSRRDSFVSGRKGSTSLKVDYNFQDRGSDFAGGCHGKGAPSFRAISNDYFKNEARGHFASEALVFGVIVITAAVPVIEGIRGLAQFVYGVL